MLKKLLTFSALVFCACIFAFNVNAASVGENVAPVELLKFNLAEDSWKNAPIPAIGQKVVSIMYTDIDVSDINDPLSDAINKKKYTKEKYAAVGIGNSKDAPGIWNKIIRYIAKKKQIKYKDAHILLDETYSLKNAWNLGDCNQRAVVIIIGKDGKIKYIKKIKSDKESEAMINEVFAVLDVETAK
jgi:predicted transcriptional regulator